MNLYHSRDASVLTSAQACVLPSDSGKVEFAVDLYNYQSSREEPAVLVVMATAYGTSAQVVCGGNTVLYFNGNGTSRLFKAERLADYRVSQGKSTGGPMTTEEKALNGIYIFQIPLKVKMCSRGGYGVFSLCAASAMSGTSTDMMEKCVPRSMMARGMERAILTLGEEKGPYKGIKKESGECYKLERDTDCPVRLTVQFYMCTDSCQLTDGNVNEIAEQIRKIYDQGLNEGSLVVDYTVPKPGLKTDKPNPRPTATTSYNPSPFVDPNVTIL